MQAKAVWLDVDPGHDDATAILLALHLPNIHLLGISTTYGNAGSYYTGTNAARCLAAFGGETRGIKVYPGADKPLLLDTKYDPEIHGADGLGGVEGLPTIDDPVVQSLIDPYDEGGGGAALRVLSGMSKHIRETYKDGAGQKVTVISCGPMTNIALFINVYPRLLEAVEQFVFMGGGVGLGNRSAVAEFNILSDPHATQIVLNSPVPAVMIPLNSTHTAIVTREIHGKLLSPKSALTETSQTSNTPLPKADTKLRHTLSTLISYFADTYKSTFGFTEGPPLHDALTVAYVSQPSLFNTRRYRVDIELGGEHTRGETVVDLWGYRQLTDPESWGRNGKNCLVAMSLDVDKFFEMFLGCVDRCDVVSYLNR